MTTLDPYAAPAAPGGGTYAPDVPQGAVEALRGTRPWVLLCSIFGCLMALLMVVLGGFVLLGGGASMFGDLGGEGAAAGGMMIGLGLVYLLMGLLYFLPCFYLFRYARRIRGMLQGGGAAAMVGALDQQRRFWRLIGIYSLVVIVLYALLLVVFAIAAAVGAAGGFGS
jgi:hypothetical protein